MRPKKIALMTAGGLAPCLNASIAGLIEGYTQRAPDIEIIGYLSGYQGILLGQSIRVTPEIRTRVDRLYRFGGSVLGNSRVKLTNKADCEKRGLVKPGEDPQEKATAQLIADGVDVLHTIGGDDTNTSAADLASFISKKGHTLTVIGLPKTVDNDVYPIQQSLGAWTAAEHGAAFFRNVASEHSANPRMLIIHEVMGRSSGWLTAATAHEYSKMLEKEEWLPQIGLDKARYSVHGVFIPEMPLNIEPEFARLKKIMDENGCVNLFVSEGAGIESIIKEMESRGAELPRDAFGHVKLDKVNAGQWFGERFAQMIGAQKVLVQKSGYYARAAAPNAYDLRLIKSCVDLAVECALKREAGVIGHDEENANVLRAIEFSRIKGGKPFDLRTAWFKDLLSNMGQALA